MKFTFRQKFFSFSFIMLLCNCLLGYAIYNGNQNLHKSEEWVQHTEQVIDQIISIFSTGNDIKTNSREFAITDDPNYITLVSMAQRKVFADIAAIKVLTSDNPSQQQRINLLNAYMHKRVDFVAKVIDIRRKGGLETAIAYMAAHNDKYYAVPVLQITNGIENTERILLRIRREINAQRRDAVNRLFILAFVIMVSFTVIFIIAIGKYLLQNTEREKRAAELIIANAELYFQNNEKEKRAGELVIANKELNYQSNEKKKRAGELIIANKELSYQSNEKEKRAAELVIADEELTYQSGEKSKRAAELLIANKELLFQNEEKGKRAAELLIANEELLFQNEEKEKRAAELVVANLELLFQNGEKEKRAVELFIANEELWYHNSEKEKRAAELAIANKELLYQNNEKEKRTVELDFVNEQLVFQNDVRKIAERNLYKSESRLKEAQALARTGNFEINLVECTDEWSDGLYAIYGLNRSDVTPSTELFLSMVHVDDLASVTAQVTAAYKFCKNFTIDFRFMREDGSIRYGYLDAKFRMNKDQVATRLFGIIQDVTDLKLADIERTQMVDDLVVRNHDLEQFAYIISHNLRAPIANIIGASDALNDSDTTNADKRILQKAISTSVLKLDDVVQDLNQILQVKANINSTREKVCFSDLVDDVKISITSLIDEDVSIVHDFTDMNELLTIKPYLYSIFYNLILNSIKYCRRDVPCHVEIKSEIEKNVLKLSFTDNGLGIDLKKKGDQVFGLYKRFHEHIEGKGMGLYMVKTQVETLGGKITVESEENEGAKFLIKFNI